MEGCKDKWRDVQTEFLPFYRTSCPLGAAAQKAVAAVVVLLVIALAVVIIFVVVVDVIDVLV